jgi:FtsP/CotA-like multicopper oxidase with cupredoxin domain
MNHLVSRRGFMRLLGTGGAAAMSGVLSGCVMQPGRRTVSNMGPPAVRGSSNDFAPDLEISLSATAASAPILPGKPTAVWTYQGSVIKGEAGSLTTLQDNYLGPIIRAKKGQRVRITFKNELPADQSSIVHWHGLRLPEEMDGHPRYAIQPGQSYVYEFEVIDRAGPYWFHPHPHGQTAHQVYMGLAGLFIVSDEEEAAADLPAGEFDVPLVIQDRTFDADNQLVYPAAAAGTMGGMMNHSMHGTGGSATPGSGGMMEDGMQMMMGVLGSQMLVNGKPDFTLPVATRAHRLRLWNGSNARIYKLGWSTGEPIVVIASDGGLLEKPVTKPYVMLAPGERVEIWADFRALKVGTEVAMVSLPFEGAEAPGGMMGGMMSGNAPPQGAPLTIFKVKVEKSEDETRALPTALSAITRLRPEDTVNASSPRQMALTLNGMQWLINGRQFQMEAVLPDETVKLGSSEVWEIVNKLNPGQMMDANGMAHPIHIHGVQFQVLSREVLPQLKAGWDTVREGLVDEGWKDTVLVMPGERVKLAMRFERYRGTFVYHCHNLEHENGGMMRNYRVT